MTLERTTSVVGDDLSVVDTALGLARTCEEPPEHAAATSVAIATPDNTITARALRSAERAMAGGYAKVGQHDTLPADMSDYE